jgi:hypothetical protein
MTARELVQTLLLVFGLSACAATGKSLSQEGANEMANLTIEAFLKARFVDAVYTLSVGERDKHVNPDGSVLMDAQFTDVNLAQLHRPPVELSRFCEAQHGRLARTRIDRARDRAERDDQRQSVEDERFCKYERVRGTESDCLAYMAQKRALTLYMAVPKAAEAAQGASPDDFGRFSCSHATPDKNPDWMVTIDGVDYEAGESGTLKANRLTLLISPR